jgi:hypothetical protein
MVDEDKTPHRASCVPQKPTKQNFSVIGLPTERLGEATRLLVRCYYSNPNFTI